MLKRIMQMALIFVFASNVFAGTQVSNNDSRKYDEYLLARLTYLLANNKYLVVRDSVSGKTFTTRAVNFHYNTDDGSISRGNLLLEGEDSLKSGKANQYVDIKIPPTGSVLPKPTTSIDINYVNLSSNDMIPPYLFDPANTSSFNFSSVGGIYDSLGEMHNMLIYYVKVGANQWKVPVIVDGEIVTVGKLNFSINGELGSTTGLDNIKLNFHGSDQAVQLKFNVTQVAMSDNPGILSGNGHSLGRFMNYGINDSGDVLVFYTNGLVEKVSKIALVNN